MLTQSAFLGKGMVMQPFQASPRAASQLTVCRAATQLKKTASSAGKAIKGPKKQPGKEQQPTHSFLACPLQPGTAKTWLLCRGITLASKHTGIYGLIEL